MGRVEVGFEKARHAVYFTRPTEMFEQTILDHGYGSAHKVPGTMPMKGGIPLTVNGQLVVQLESEGVLQDKMGVYFKPEPTHSR